MDLEKLKDFLGSTITSHWLQQPEQVAVKQVLFLSPLHIPLFILKNFFLKKRNFKRRYNWSTFEVPVSHCTATAVAAAGYGSFPPLRGRI